ncbi:hypothetical protein GCM10027051_20420 [Niabella terrae]
MTIVEQIDRYLQSQPESKKADMLLLHQELIRLLPRGRLWFLDGRDATGKLVSHPSIGYGVYVQDFADGTREERYQIGMSAPASGISLYLMGLSDRKYLKANFADRIGKATVTGYCIRFKSLQDLNREVLIEAIQYGIGVTGSDGKQG